MVKMNSSEVEVVLYTDGACSGNPGPGGWAFILEHLPTGKRVEASGAEWDTTNNRMEMLSVVNGLKRLNRPTRVKVVSDSNYLVQGMTSWIKGWKKNNWRRKTNNGFEPVKNEDIWKELDQLAQTHQVTFEHVRGHAGHPENERCDELAVEAYKKLMREKRKTKAL